MVVLFVSVIVPKACIAAVVSTCDEAGLRVALSSGGTITFACDGTITLSNTITVATDTVLDGSGHNVVISGNGLVRIFHIQPAVAVAISNLTIAHGRSPMGGGIYNEGGNLTIANSVVRDNRALATNTEPDTAGLPAYGGGVFNNGGHITLLDSTFSNNVAQGWSGTSARTATEGAGGALCNRDGTVNATNIWFVANTAQGGNGGSAFNGGSGGNGSGGAIVSSNGFLSLTGVHFHTNVARGGSPGPWVLGEYETGGSAFGGGVAAVHSTVQVSATAFKENAAVAADSIGSSPQNSASGGGLYNGTGNSATLSDSLFSGNHARAGDGGEFTAPGTSADGSGGAIFNADRLAIKSTTFSSNSAAGGRASNRWLGGSGGPGQGGAIMNAGTATISECAFVNNVALGGIGSFRDDGPSPRVNDAGLGIGGGIANTNRLSVTNCTFFGNSARGGSGYLEAGQDVGRGGSGCGGALAYSGVTELANVTMARNAARGGMGNPGGRGYGGAIGNPSGPPFRPARPATGTCLLRNCILAGSLSASDCFGTVIDGGHNISSDESCLFTNASSLNNTDPIIGPLGDYGGPTPTVPLLAGSPAIGHADSAACPPVDQRGRVRPFGPGPDIGAFESSPPYTIRGRVRGLGIPPELEVRIGDASSTTDTQGEYRFDGLSAGSHTVTAPSRPSIIFVPRNRMISLGSDVVNVDIAAYWINSLNLDPFTNAVVPFIFAGAPGETWRVQTSTNLFDWNDFSTNSVDAEGLLRIFDTISATPRTRFFRMVKP